MSTKKKPVTASPKAKPATNPSGAVYLATVMPGMPAQQNCCQTAPATPLTEAIDRLDVRLKTLKERFERLAGKLDPVMTQLPCGITGCSAPMARPDHSAVVDRLDSLASRISDIDDHVSACLERLEV